MTDIILNDAVLTANQIPSTGYRFNVGLAYYTAESCGLKEGVFLGRKNTLQKQIIPVYQVVESIISDGTTKVCLIKIDTGEKFCKTLRDVYEEGINTAASNEAEWAEIESINSKIKAKLNIKN